MAEVAGLEAEEVHERYVEVIWKMRDEFSVRPEVTGVTMEVVRLWCGVEESERYDKAVKKMMELYLDPFEECEGASEIVDLVAKTRVRTGVVSIAGEEWTRRKLRKHFFGKFESFYCVNPVEVKDAMAWYKALSKFEVLPEEVMVVGDSWKSDILPALDLRMKKIIWVNTRGEEYKDERVTEIEGVKELREVLI